MAFKYTEDQLNKMDKALLIELFLGLQDQMEELTKETHALNQKMQLLMEQVVLAKHHRFGRSTERMEDTTQISFMEIDGKIVFFNEAEAVSDPDMEEPEELELKKGSRRKQGKKDQDLSGLPVRRIDHYLSEQELEDEFGENGWKQLPDMISRQYCFVPAKVEIEEHHIVLYEYQKTRNASHPVRFLKDYEGICVTDGYQVYHSAEKTLVDALFAYAKQHQVPVGTQGKLARAVTYLLNQEKYLRVFLENGEVPMDNNASERAIRGFCIGRKNWQLIDTIRGAENSAIIYSIAETAKANDLKPYEYFEHLLTEIPKHMEDTDRSFLDDVLPWSEKLPKEIKKTNKRS